MKKLFAVILSLCFLLSAAVGCATNGDKPSDSTAESSGDVTTAAGTEPFYNDLDYDGAEINIAHRGERFDKYILGEEGGDALWASIYDTNIKIADSLGVTVRFISGPTNQSEFITQAIAESVTDNCYELILPDQFYGTSPAATGAYKNLLNLGGEKNYLDITQPCWYGDYMEKITMHNDTLYFLAGDISPTILAWASCSFVNHSLYEDIFGDTDEFLQSVLDGKWTLDVLMEKSKAAYLDLNQNSQMDLDDRLGSATSKGQAAKFVLTSAGFQFVRTLNDGTLELAMDTERNADIFSKVFELYQHTEGFTTYDYNNAPNGNFDTFADGRMLFMNEYLIFSFEDKIREMSDPYVIIPRPKADEQEEKYHSSLQDSLFLYVIPVSVESSKDEMISAYLQAACMLYNENVVPAMFDTALKIKFVADEVDVDMAGKLIDLVRTGITTDFALVYDSSTGFSGQLYSVVQNSQGQWASVLAQTAKHEATLAGLLEKFEELRQAEKNRK